MNLINKINELFGKITIEIEGFFTERFLNICKFNRIKIFDIKNIISGKVRFTMYIKDFKKIKKIAKKTKCRVKIKNKKGIYFLFFKYRKRKIVILFFILFIILFVFSNKLIWNIEIDGNIKYTDSEIIRNLKDIGINKIMFKKDINTNDISKKLRSKLTNCSFVSVSIKGTILKLNIKEKVISSNNIKKIGDIYSTKNGILNKIIVENGTARYKIGSYIEKDMMLIEGKIYSDYIPVKDVSAKGKVYIQTEYIFEKKYNYVNKIKKNLNFIRYNVGFSLNFKEFYINYLNKEKKYDKIKYSKSFNVLGHSFSLDFYKFIEYIEENRKRSVEEIKSIFELDSSKYIEGIKNKSNEFKIINEFIDIKKYDNYVLLRKKFIVSEEIGKFIERKKND